MRAKDLRADMRIPVDQRGTLNSGDDWFPCLIVDMSESGILIMSNREFPVGQVLEFRCEPFPGETSQMQARGHTCQRHGSGHEDNRNRREGN